MAIEVANAKPKAPWIGIGASGEWTDVQEAMAAAGLNFAVGSRTMEYQCKADDSGSFVTYNPVPGFKANVREDTDQFLGCVSGTYQIVQNEEVFSLLEPFIQAGGKITHAGMTDQGLCFMVAEVENASIAGDSYSINVMATNSFNGAFPAAVICTPLRIICQNMYRSLMGQSDSVARYRHSLNASQRLGAMKAAYDMFTSYNGQFSENVERLKLEKAKHSIEEFVELMYPYGNAEEGTKRFVTSRDKVDDKRMQYIEKYYYSKTNSDQGSKFALVNAYYDFISHATPERADYHAYAGKRLSNIVAGTSVSNKLMQFMCE